MGSHRSPALRWLHGLLGLFLLLGAVDIHPAADAHASLAGVAGEAVYFPAAAHPGQPVHLEEADPVQRPHCAACLHRLETRGAHLQPAASALPAERPVRLGLAPDPRATGGSARTSGARAPPFS